MPCKAKAEFRSTTSKLSGCVAIFIVALILATVIGGNIYYHNKYRNSLPRVAIVDEPCYVFDPSAQTVRIWEVVGRGTTTDDGSPCICLRPYTSDTEGVWYCGESASSNLKVGQKVVYESIENKLCVVDIDNPVAILSTSEQVRNRFRQ